MAKSYNLYYNLGWWFLGFIILVVAGFYHTYFSNFFAPRPIIEHVHFTGMAIWLSMLIIQPFLIKNKKTAWHRLVGKASYVVVPLVVLTTYLMIRHSYLKFLNQATPGSSVQPSFAIMSQAAEVNAIGIVVLAVFITMYCLAVYNRKRSAVHSRFMLATGLTLLGPALDRMMTILFNVQLPGSIPIFYLTFLITDLLLLLLIWKDYREKRPTRTLWICFFIYLAAHVVFATAPGSDWWTNVVAFVMKPSWFF